MTEKYHSAIEAGIRADKVAAKFDEIEKLLEEIVELGASNQRLKLGLRHYLQKYTHDRA